MGKAGRRVRAIAAVPEKIEEAIEEAIEEECVALKDVPEEPEDEIVYDAVEDTSLNKDSGSPVDGFEKISKELLIEKETSKGDNKCDGKTSDGDDAAIIESTILKDDKETNSEEVKIEKEAASDDNKLDGPIDNVTNTNESPSKTVKKENNVKELKVSEETALDVNKCDDGADTVNETNVDKLKDDVKVTADHQINDT